MRLHKKLIDALRAIKPRFIVVTTDSIVATYDPDDPGERLSVTLLTDIIGDCSIASPYAMSAERFFAACSKAKEIELQQPESGFVLVRQNGAETKIPTVSPSDVPALDYAEVHVPKDYLSDLTASDLADALETSLTAVGPVRSDSSWNGLAIEPGILDKGIPGHVIRTDSHRLSIVSIQYAGEKIVVPQTVLRAAKALRLMGGASVQIAQSLLGSCVTISGPQGQIRIAPSVDTFPRWQSIFPKLQPIRVAFHSRPFGAMAAEAGKAGDKSRVDIRFNGAIDMASSNEATGSTFSGTLPRLAVKGLPESGEFNLAFNGGYISQACRALTGSNILSLDLTGPSIPAVFTGKSKGGLRTQVLVMPIAK